MGAQRMAVGVILLLQLRKSENCEQAFTAAEAVNSFARLLPGTDFI
jgi:hypothetical protein